MAGPKSSHPPSEPTEERREGGRADSNDTGMAGRAMRVQALVASVIGFSLLGVGLYLWRRPHAPTGRDWPLESAPDAVAADAGTGLSVAEAGSPAGPVVLSEARVIGCHDRGPRKTPPDQCDRPVSVEAALSRAIEKASDCVSAPSEAATIEYVADVSFTRRTVRIGLPRAGRTVHDRKTVAACAAAVRDGMRDTDLTGVSHEHARYEIAISATYRAKG
jgi:hypothetical protein